MKNRMNGFVKINETVVASVAAIAASEVEGVVKYLYGKKPSSISKKSKKLVKLMFNETGVTIDIFIGVKYGYILPEVGSAVQENIIQSVETLTGLKVDAVNVHFSGVAFGKENVKEK